MLVPVLILGFLSQSLRFVLSIKFPLIVFPMFLSFLKLEFQHPSIFWSCGLLSIINGEIKPLYLYGRIAPIQPIFYAILFVHPLFYKLEVNKKRI